MIHTVDQHTAAAYSIGGQPMGAPPPDQPYPGPGWVWTAKGWVFPARVWNAEVDVDAPTAHRGGRAPVLWRLLLVGCSPVWGLAVAMWCGIAWRVFRWASGQ